MLNRFVESKKTTFFAVSPGEIFSASGVGFLISGLTGGGGEGNLGTCLVSSDRAEAAAPVV